MTNRSVLITGAAGGIGRATVECFAAAKWNVIATDRQVADSYSPGVRFLRMDVSRPDDVKACFSTLARDIEQLDALVNNAAIQICKPITEMEIEEWDATMNSNLRSIFLTVKYGYPLLQAAQGAIVNVSSVHAVATSKDIAAYASSKGGSLALTRAMALEFAADGVRVNTVLPGAVDTNMLRDGLSRGHVSGGNVEDQLNALGAKTVMGRVGEAHEIAQAILFLADGTRSSFMTGQSLVVDGGATARLSTE
jgi:glucose 1-dehydrogenase